MNILQRLFNRNKPNTTKRVRNSNWKYARKVKLGGMMEGYFYMESKAMRTIQSV